MFKLPSEVASPSGYFDPNFGLGHRQNNLCPNPQVIVESANKWLNRYGYTDLVESDFEKDHNYISSEVGDDEETASDSKAFIALQLVNHEMYGMKVSLEDTSISSRFGNFAEDLIVLPDGYGQTYLNARKTGNFDCMSFIDVPKLRLAIDIRPMRMDHSSTNDGKASMIGARQQWIPLNNPFRGRYEIFNLFQDVNLGLHRDKKFPYLPSALGGYGKTPPFQKNINLERFMKAFKQGTHSELIRNIVNRTIDYIGSLIRGENPEKDPLLSHVVRFQSSFHDWVKGRSIYAPVTWLDVPQEVAKYQAAKLGASPVEDEVIIRLMSEGKLISEQQLEIAVEHNELCNALLKAESIPQFKKLRDDARMRWSSFSVFSLENYGMIKELSLDRSFSKRPLRDIDISMFYSLVKEMRYNLRFILGEEYVYWPEAMNEIYRTGPMKVSFSMMPLNKVHTRGFAAQRSEYKTDHEDIEEKDAIPNLEVWFRGDRKGPVPREIVNDDNAIVEECSRHPYNIIVTDDIKLCKLASRTTGQPVFRVPTLWYHKVVYFGVGEHWDDYLGRKTPQIKWVEHVDTGSIKAFEEAQFLDGVMLSRPMRQKFSAFKTISSKDKIEKSEMEDYSDRIPVDDIGKLFFDPKNMLRLRANNRRIPVAKSHNSSDQQSWRTPAGSHISKGM